MPQNLEMKIVVESQSERLDEQYLYHTTVKLPFTSSFKIKNDIKEITFSRTNRTNYIYVNNLNDLEVGLEDSSLATVESNHDENNNHIKVYVPHNVTSDFNDVKLTLKNKLTGQQQEIFLNYIAEKAEEPRKVFFGLIKRDTLVDLVTLLILVVIIVILANYLYSSVYFHLI